MSGRKPKRVRFDPSLDDIHGPPSLLEPSSSSNNPFSSPAKILGPRKKPPKSPGKSQLRFQQFSVGDDDTDDRDGLDEGAASGKVSKKLFF